MKYLPRTMPPGRFALLRLTPQKLSRRIMCGAIPPSGERMNFKYWEELYYALPEGELRNRMHLEIEALRTEIRAETATLLRQAGSNGLKMLENLKQANDIVVRLDAENIALKKQIAELKVHPDDWESRKMFQS
jgi:hypothetical protein